MSDQERTCDAHEEFWYSGKVTRRRVIGYGVGAGALGATMLVPAPWQAAFGQAKPYKIGTLQPLSGAGAAGGKTALVGLQMAVDRINKAGGINGRPIEIVVADDESKPDVGRRKAEKLAGRGQDRRPRRRLPLQHLPRLHAGVRGVQDRQHDQRVPRHHADHHQVQPVHLPAVRLRAVAGGGVRALRSSSMGKRWHIAYADYSWGQSTRTPTSEQIKKAGGEVVGTTGIPLGTADMTPFLSKITGNFDGLFGIFFGKDGVTIGNQAFDLGLTKKYKWAGDGAIAESTNLPALGNKIEGFVGINRYVPVLEGAAQHAGAQEVLRRGRGPAQGDRLRPARIPIATCNRTTRR